MTHQVVKSFISDSLYDSSDWAGQQWTADHLYCSHFPYLARTQPRRAQGGRGQLLLKIALIDDCESHTSHFTALMAFTKPDIVTEAGENGGK